MKITTKKMTNLKLNIASLITQYNCNFTGNTATNGVGGAVYF
jgi:hypothetical protein